MELGIPSPYLSNIRPKSAKGERRVRSARAGGGRVFVQRDATALPKIHRRTRPFSADGERTLFLTSNAPLATVVFAGRFVGRAATAKTARSESSARRSRPFSSRIPSMYGAFCISHLNLNIRSSNAKCFCYCSLDLGSAIMVDVGARLAEGERFECPGALRLRLLGHPSSVCRCSRQKIPHISDVEFDEFVFRHAPENQLIVVAVRNSR